MIHAGNAITVQMLQDGIAEFRFDLLGESVNKFNKATIDDFQAAIAAVQAHPEIQGLVVTSAKSTFIVGADITEFGANFAQGEAVIQEWLVNIHQIFNSFEDLNIPKVVAINGMALVAVLKCAWCVTIVSWRSQRKSVYLKSSSVFSQVLVAQCV